MASVQYKGGPTPVSAKDPSGVLDYRIEWTEWLETDTIAISTWIVPIGITKMSESNDATTATVWLSGGTALTEYHVTNEITTAQGRTAQRTMIVPVREL